MKVITLNNERYISTADLLTELMIEEEDAKVLDDENKALFSLLTRLQEKIIFAGRTAEDIKRIKKEAQKIPGRYLVGKDMGNHVLYFAGSEKEINTFTDCPYAAKRYVSYKEAEACRDFIDTPGDWEVFDFFNGLTADERLRRAIFAEDADDEGNENAIRIKFRPADKTSLDTNTNP